MDTGLLSLKWNNHSTTFFHVLASIRLKQHDSYSDVTLACDGKFFPVHKLVLSSCSDYFEQIFASTQCKQPVIVLHNMRVGELEALLNYMYLGEVSVLQADLAGLIKAAECLKIKGLAVPDEAPSPPRKRDRVADSLEKKSANKDVSQPHKRVKVETDGEYHHRDAASSSLSVIGEREISRPCASQERATNNAEAPSPSPSHSLEVIEDSQSNVKQEVIDETDTKQETEDNVFNSYDSLTPGLQGDGVSEGSQGFDQILSNQAQTMEELVAQSMPGTSGLQGDVNWSSQGGGGDMSRFPLDNFQVDDSQGSGVSQQQQPVVSVINIVSFYYCWWKLHNSLHVNYKLKVHTSSYHI
ncbi:hypothetical protein SK128_026793 [Halocaridina rubra]|uniref:BTB domain-containing protein n=1 Tax=Halocaridina rubra TaxID=373956 RepID=A0AAN9AAB5_HALRR